MDEGYCRCIPSPNWGCYHDTRLSAADVRVGSMLSKKSPCQAPSRAREGHSAASGRQNGTLLCGDSGGLNAVSPCYDVAAQQFCQILGAPVLWRRRTRPEVLHSLAHRRRVKRLGRRLVEAPHNRLRRSPWADKSVPAVVAI